MSKIFSLTFFLARISSIIIGLTVFAFVGLAAQPMPLTQTIICLVIGLIILIGFILLIIRKRDFRLFALLPLVYGAFLFISYFFHGFLANVTLLGLIISLSLATLPTLGNYYAWRNPKSGGLLFIGYAVLYLFLAFNSVAPLYIGIVMAVLILTGLGFIFAPTKLVLTKPFVTTPTASDTVTSQTRTPKSVGWRSLKQTEQSPS